ncbi:MAG: transporter substrate-binding domain-containing protein [Firmicutes bacterium]|nr:transporter substrate-binding domain-containing protein [Bacillota bacterium]
MRRKSVEIFLVFLLTASMLLSLVGCSENSGAVYNNRDNSLQNVLDAGQLVVGIDGAFLSMAFKDDSGEYAGFDIDVAKKVCDNLGIELVIKEIEWKDKIDILNAREINCIWSAMSVSSEREKAMDLSEPYLQNEVIIIVPESSDAISKNDLKGKIVGLTGGTTGYEMFYADEIRNEVSIVIDNCDTLLQKLQGGIIDAVVIDSTVGYYFLSHSKEKYFILSESLGSEKYAIGFKKGDIALRDRIQEEINKLRKSGELSEISQKWFGSDITTV